jgi:hypothetical protein
MACPVALGSPPGRGGLRCHHMSRGSRPASRCRRALESPRATWLSTFYGTEAKGKYSASLLNQLSPPTFEVCLCVPKTPDISLIMTLPGTQSRQHIKYLQGSHMRRMGSIKCV